MILAGLVEPLEAPSLADTLPTWLMPHQADAVQRARAILARFGGVLIADGVGLGKTWLGLALAALEAADGGSAVAIVPPALRLEWSRAGEQAGVAIPVLSHLQLPREPRRLDDVTLLIVDEAHAFRNPRTQRYDALSRLAIGRRIALLSATPLNNTPADLHALIHLFAPDDRFRELGVADLGEALRGDATPAAAVLGAVSVCRTRRLVEQRFPDTRARFPRRVLQPPVRYDLDACYGGQLRWLLEHIASLADAPARLESAAGLMQLGLLRRLESSRAAFRRTLLRHVEYLEEVARAAGSGVRIDRSDYRALFPRGDSDDAQLVMWPVLKPAESGAVPLVAHQWRSALMGALALVEPLVAGPEAKFAALEAALAGELRGKRVIVFTEYRDTALDLLRRLRISHRVIAVAGADAWAGSGVVERDEALDAFAPAARGSRCHPLMEADILVATDVAGAGLNLQDAQAVVNYDLPWNPVRIMQRVGRIDRLGSHHQEIHVAHLLPSGGLHELTRVLTALRDKLDHAGVLAGSEPDPLAALWWVGDGAPDQAALEHESWRRVAPFEARERWRAAAGDTKRGPQAAIAAGVTRDGPAAVGLLLALAWRSGHIVPLPYVVTTSGEVRESACELGEIAERALLARSIPADTSSFAAVLATVLPFARQRMVELSAGRYGAPSPGPGQRDALDILTREHELCRRHRCTMGDIEIALEGLESGITAGLEREIADQSRRRIPPSILATNVRLLLERSIAPSAPELHGTPRLDLIAAIVLTTECPS